MFLFQSRPGADTVKAMAKMIKQEGESTRNSIRAARRAALEQVKKFASKDAQKQEEKKVRELRMWLQSLQPKKSMHLRQMQTITGAGISASH